ncbi:MAG: hypothetical protein LBI05_05845 [Planctomycetaceae bacterium]|jgi:hypothetical protein|nr:hypothetical protein [Planctomycetaceae bacterium]
MQYSIYTRGYNTDYSWKNSKPELNFQEYLGANGLLVARRIDGTFTAYLVSSPTVKTDYMSRNISIAVLVGGCTEAKAKGLAVWALEHWGNFGDTFSTFVDDFGKDGWTVNDSAIEQWIDSITDIPATAAPFENRFAGDSNETSSRKQLIAELKQFRFNPKAGIKLVVDGGLLPGPPFEDIQYAVDRYLYKGGERKALPNEPSSEKTLTKRTPVPTSSKSSSPLLVGFVGLILGVVGCLLYFNFYPASPLVWAKTVLEEHKTLEGLKTAVADAKRDQQDAEVARDTAYNERDSAVAARDKANAEKQDAEAALKNARQLAEALTDGAPTQLLRRLRSIKDKSVQDGLIGIVKIWLAEIESSSSPPAPPINELQGQRQPEPSGNVGAPVSGAAP